MHKSTSSLRVAARGGALTIAIAAALLLGAGTTASAHVAVLTPAGAVTQDDNGDACAAAEATLEAAQQRLEAAYEADKRALETARETVGDQNEAARDLLKQAAADLKTVFRTADAALAIAADDTNCATFDEVAITALVDQAIVDMDAVVNTAIAGLPADQVKANDDGEGDD